MTGDKVMTATPIISMIPGSREYSVVVGRVGGVKHRQRVVASLAPSCPRSLQLSLAALRHSQHERWLEELEQLCRGPHRGCDRDQSDVIMVILETLRGTSAVNMMGSNSPYISPDDIITLPAATSEVSEHLFLETRS